MSCHLRCDYIIFYILTSEYLSLLPSAVWNSCQFCFVNKFYCYCVSFCLLLWSESVFIENMELLSVYRRSVSIEGVNQVLGVDLRVSCFSISLPSLTETAICLSNSLWFSSRILVYSQLMALMAFILMKLTKYRNTRCWRSLIAKLHLIAKS